MPRRRASQSSTSSELSTSSEPSENININEEFPDAGLAKTRGKGKNTATNSKYPCEVKQLKKLRQINEKDVKVAANKVNKVYKITDCVKSMNIEMHPALFSAWYMCEVPGEAASLGVTVLPAHDICDPCALLYTQNVSRSITTEGGQVRLTPGKTRCNCSLYIMTAAEAANSVRSRTLTDHMRQKRELIGGKLTLVIFDSNQYFQKASKRSNKGVNDGVNDVELEMAITDVLVALKIETIKVHSATELAQLVVQYARAIAEEPFKRSKREIDEQAEFYMRGDNKNCVSVDKDGNGVSRLWQQMLAVLPTSSLEISRSLTAQYSSPRTLANEVSTGEGMSRVAALGVSRAAHGRGRRLGPELTKKLHVLFTATDGDQLIE